jgi:hypothetical protein
MRVVAGLEVAAEVLRRADADDEVLGGRLDGSKSGPVP